MKLETKTLDEILEKVNERSHEIYYKYLDDDKIIYDNYIQSTLEMLYDADVIYSENVYRYLLNQSLNFGLQIKPEMIYQCNIDDILSDTL